MEPHRGPAPTAEKKSTQDTRARSPPAVTSRAPAVAPRQRLLARYTSHRSASPLRHARLEVGVRRVPAARDRRGPPVTAGSAIRPLRTPTGHEARRFRDVRPPPREDRSGTSRTREKSVAFRSAVAAVTAREAEIEEPQTNVHTCSLHRREAGRALAQERLAGEKRPSRRASSRVCARPEPVEGIALPAITPPSRSRPPPPPAARASGARATPPRRAGARPPPS